MKENIFKGDTDYWQVAELIKNVYFSEGTLATLLDFERVLDELDIYAFKNWALGELVVGPEVTRYKVSCTFMYPEKYMPDPRGGMRLLPFDAEVNYKKTTITIPIKVKDQGDYRPGTHKPRLIKKPVWLVEITLPKSLMGDIQKGSIELEDEIIDLSEIENSYDEDLNQEQYQEEEAVV